MGEQAGYDLIWGETGLGLDGWHVGWTDVVLFFWSEGLCWALVDEVNLGGQMR